MSEEDVGEADLNQIKISLKVQVLVQQTYNSISRLLRNKLKDYIEDLLNKQ